MGSDIPGEGPRWSGDGGPGFGQVKDEEAQLLPTEEFEYEEDDDFTARHARPVGQASNSPGRGSLFARLLLGPHPPETLTVKPIWPGIQEAPLKFLDRHFPQRLHKTGLLVLFLCCWLLAFAVPLVLSNAGPSRAPGDSSELRRLDCTDTLWAKDSGCGIDGADCQPFSDSSFAFYCPANCAGVQVLNPHAVGGKEVVYRPLIIGGPVYRGDSFICGSAVHAGVIDDGRGGCGVVRRVGEHINFPVLRQNGIESVEFDSYFPLSFEIRTGDGADTRQCGVTDPRASLLPVSLVFTALLSLFTASPAVQFFTTFTAIFAHVALASDPPGYSGPAAGYLPELVSSFAGRLLPALFCAVIIYRVCARRTLAGLTAQAEKTLLWLGGFWFGALSNYTFGWLPIQRLTAHDLEQQPGAKVALAAILVMLVLIAAQQILALRREGRLPRYLLLYGAFLAAIAAGVALPGLELRIHHYVLALLLLPGTAVQTRPALLYQGLLLGLFANGVARWGFASVLETAAALRADGALGSLLPSLAAEPAVAVAGALSNITFDWTTVLAPEALRSGRFDGLSVLVNDVERYRGFFAGGADEARGGVGGAENFTWARRSVNELEYFRFAFVRDGAALDYTKAAVWRMDGTWQGVPVEDP